MTITTSQIHSLRLRCGQWLLQAVQGFKLSHHKRELSVSLFHFLVFRQLFTFALLKNTRRPRRPFLTIFIYLHSLTHSLRRPGGYSYTKFVFNFQFEKLFTFAFLKTSLFLTIVILNLYLIFILRSLIKYAFLIY